MKNMRSFLWILLFILILVSCGKQVDPPAAYGPVPTERQMNWQKMEFLAFFHFTTNTFTGLEWGYGDESPEIFNPTNLDCRQWVRVAKEAGMNGVILTAKHHDGFCLWPSEYTSHSVSSSPWKDGNGDVIRELAEACKEYDMKMGLYLSPWDRNSAVYGDTAYITYYRNQLREILTNYGDIYEVWFDGANGGDGYYGGTREERKIDRKTYYDWPGTRKIVRELQPNAVMFSDAGPDVRWVGNEYGFAGETNWSHLNAIEFYPGSSNYKELPSGQENGADWIPAECDVSIRPGWFYHEKEDSLVKTVGELMQIYYNSVGRNGTFLLNLPPDKTGRINELDVEVLKEFRKALDKEFVCNLAVGKKVFADSWRGKSKKYSASNLTDENEDTYWCTDEDILTGVLSIDLDEKTEVNRILIQEHIVLGQRIKAFIIEALVDGAWKEVANGTTIGYKRILSFPTIKTAGIRLSITESNACPVLNNIELYRAPEQNWE